MIAGSRKLETVTDLDVMGTLDDIVMSSTKVVVGCAVGVDACVLKVMLSRQLCHNLTVFAVGGWDGSGFPTGENLPLIRAVEAAGATIKWWAGGSSKFPMKSRLYLRSLNCTSLSTHGVFILTTEHSPGTINVLRHCLMRDRYDVKVIPYFVSLPIFSNFTAIRLDDITYTYEENGI